MSDCRIIVGDALTELRAMDPESVHCCITSPPYFGLRDYGVAGQLGLEPTPGEYVAAMVAVFREVRRVLRPDGTLWLNIGDSYAGSGKGGNPGHSPHIKQETNAGSLSVRGVKRDDPSCKPKDMIGIPWTVAFALRADGWYLRSDIIWHKPNPMPESITDRPTKAHEYLFLLAKNERYHYDADAIKEPASGAHARTKVWVAGWAKDGGDHTSVAHNRPGIHPKARRKPDGKVKQNESFSAAVAGLVSARNKRTVWTVGSQAFPDAHFATFPPKLIEPCVLAGCPAGGVVLDPFGGAGTTGLVATMHGRNSVLIELNPEYAEMARARVAVAADQHALDFAEGT